MLQLKKEEKMAAEDVKQQALKEIEDEDFRKKVEAEKARILELRNRKSWFPWRISFVFVNLNQED